MSVVNDLDGLKLPNQGKLIKDVHEAEDLLEMAKEAGFDSPHSASSSQSPVT